LRQRDFMGRNEDDKFKFTGIRQDVMRGEGRATGNNLGLLISLHIHNPYGRPGVTFIARDSQLSMDGVGCDISKRDAPRALSLRRFPLPEEFAPTIHEVPHVGHVEAGRAAIHPVDVPFACFRVIGT
jgi:hypothetical protein